MNRLFSGFMLSPGPAAGGAAGGGAAPAPTQAAPGAKGGEQANLGDYVNASELPTLLGGKKGVYHIVNGKNVFVPANELASLFGRANGLSVKQQALVETARQNGLDLTAKDLKSEFKRWGDDKVAGLKEITAQAKAGNAEAKRFLADLGIEIGEAPKADGTELATPANRATRRAAFLTEYHLTEEDIENYPANKAMVDALLREQERNDAKAGGGTQGLDEAGVRNVTLQTLQSVEQGKDWGAAKSAIETAMPGDENETEREMAYGAILQLQKRVGGTFTDAAQKYLGGRATPITSPEQVPPDVRARIELDHAARLANGGDDKETPPPWMTRSAGGAPGAVDTKDPKAIADRIKANRADFRSRF